MNSIGDKVKLSYDGKRGGLITRDSLGFFRRTSIELVDHGGRKQALGYECPQIEFDRNYVRSQGYIPNSPVKYDVLTKVEGYEVTMDFKTVFESDLPKVRHHKIWGYIKASSALVNDGKKTQKIVLRGTGKRWTYPYKELGETSNNVITLINSKGSLTISKEKVTPYLGERLAIYSTGSVLEYILDWIHEKPGVPIEKGTECHCILKLRYKPF